ncbi:ATP-binding protein [Methanoculleus frigidifontis]|uniref:ATP-binding protein n=1 Tax=Methanoculleus frigidifontis TaxID=2584085 RepID=UPI0026595872|nr:ATP-binding protein [Methanoculleus sp. FWC-SCC1]
MLQPASGRCPGCSITGPSSGRAWSSAGARSAIREGNLSPLPSLTLEKLRQAHGSVPGNPLLAEPMYLTGYIERMGTGTRDMIRRCTEAGLPEPEFGVSDGFPDDHSPAPGQGCSQRYSQCLLNAPSGRRQNPYPAPPARGDKC